MHIYVIYTTGLNQLTYGNKYNLICIYHTICGKVVLYVPDINKQARCEAPLSVLLIDDNSGTLKLKYHCFKVGLLVNQVNRHSGWKSVSRRRTWAYKTTLRIGASHGCFPSALRTIITAISGANCAEQNTLLTRCVWICYGGGLPIHLYDQFSPSVFLSAKTANSVLYYALHALFSSAKCASGIIRHLIRP